MIRKGHSELSVVKQCKLLSIHRSGLYYKPKVESKLNLQLMREMDEHYLHHPFKGAKRMYIWLTKDRGYNVSLNRIERLYYKVMGLRACRADTPQDVVKAILYTLIYYVILQLIDLIRSGQLILLTFLWKRDICIW